MPDEDIGFPPGSTDERELLLQWLTYLRRAVLRKAKGLTDDQARWRPHRQLISIIGIVHHLSRVEWRWIDGGFAGVDVSREEAEFDPGPEVSLDDAVARYRARWIATDNTVTSLSLNQAGAGWAEGHDLRFVLLHLINETARHAGHGDATRELLDGVTGE